MKKLIIALSLFASFTMQAAVAAPVAVIVNSSNHENVTQADVRNIYLGNTIAWENGKKIAIYNLPTEDAAAEIFARETLDTSAAGAAAAESNRIVSNTTRNPQQTKRDALVASIVAKNPLAIGYVPTAQVEEKPGIRVLFILE